MIYLYQPLTGFGINHQTTFFRTGHFPFSKRAWSDRQPQYAQYFKFESVYTPQAIVNGKAAFVGSDKSALWNAINTSRENVGDFINTEVPEVKDQHLSINYHCAAI